MKPIYRAGHTLCTIAHRLLFRGECSGLEFIPKTGPFLLAANHLSFLDPPFIGCHVPREIYFFARKSLFGSGLWGRVLRDVNAIPVDLERDTDLAAIKQIFRILKDGNGLLVFPEGTRSIDGQLQEARSGIGMIACKSNVPIIPARIFGSHEAFGRGRPLKPFTPVSIAFGPPLHPAGIRPDKKGRQRYQAVSERIMESIAALQPPPVSTL